MKRMIIIVVCFVVLGSGVAVLVARRASVPQVASGYRLETIAKLKRPGAFAVDPRGRVLVSQPRAGQVVLLPSTVILKDLTMPFGLAFYTDRTDETDTTYLYIAETHQVTRWKYDAEQGSITDTEGTVIAKLVPNDLHPLRSLIIGPNYRTERIFRGREPVDTLAPTKLYIGSGSTCDACIEATWKSAAILESDPEGTFTAEFAGGLRSPLGLATNPGTGELWAVEQSAEGLFDEVNIIRAATAEHEFGARRYGWPFCFGDRQRDERFRPEAVFRRDIPQDCAQTEPPAQLLPADADPAGIAFWNGAFVLALRDSLTINNQAVITGIAPSALAAAPDGTLLIADSRSGTVYRMTIE